VGVQSHHSDCGRFRSNRRSPITGPPSAACFPDPVVYHMGNISPTSSSGSRSSATQPMQRKHDVCGRREVFSGTRQQRIIIWGSYGLDTDMLNQGTTQMTFGGPCTGSYSGPRPGGSTHAMAFACNMTCPYVFTGGVSTSRLPHWVKSPQSV